MTVVELTGDMCPAWDAYVRAAAGGLPLHLSGWREVMARTGGYETRYLLARQDGRIVGVLPLFFVRSLLVGNTAMTLPGGLCADDDEVAAALLRQGQDHARRAKMRRFVVLDGRRAWLAGLATLSEHVHWAVDVRPGPAALWDGLDRNLRRQVRMARSNGVSVEIDRTGQALDAFYDVFSRFTHEVGTPVYSRRFLEHVVDTFPGGFNIALVRLAGQPIGGFFQLEMGRTMLGMWGATLYAHLALRPNYLAYWSLLEDAAQRGFHTLDMGRSPAGSTASAFKGQWGGVCSPVYRQFATLDSAGATDAGPGAPVARTESSGMHLLSRVWPTLPLPVASYLGPMLRRHVPFG